MATRVTTVITCDVCDGPEASELRFTVGGRDLSIDLCDGCRQTWNAAVGPFVAAARPAPRRSAGPHALVAKPRAYDLEQLRAWASANDVNLPQRGRMPRAILEQYESWSRETAGRKSKVK